MAYKFDLVCPRCGKTSETVQLHQSPAPRVNCGDCLMNDVEIVQLMIVNVTRSALEGQFDG